MVKQYELIVIVSLYIIFMFFINISHLRYIKRRINTSPFSNDLLKLIIIAIPLMLFSIILEFTFIYLEFMLLHAVLYLVLFVLFLKRVINIIS